MASKKYSWSLTETAETDIDDILEYISGTLKNPEAATAFADELEEKMENVCKAPKSGKLVDNAFLTGKDVRRFLVKNYVAYYIIDDDNREIVIQRVVYGQRDQDRILKDSV